MHKRLSCCTLAMLVLIPVASWGEPTTIERHWARLIATFTRLGASRKSRPRGALSASLAVSEKIATGASWP
jgi:hypothetical protein